MGYFVIFFVFYPVVNVLHGVSIPWLLGTDKVDNDVGVSNHGHQFFVCVSLDIEAVTHDIKSVENEG